MSSNDSVNPVVDMIKQNKSEIIFLFGQDKISFNKKRIYKMMPKGKYYEYQVKKAALDDDLLAGHIDEVQYARESLDLDLKYEGYITPKNDA